MAGKFVYDSSVLSVGINAGSTAVDEMNRVFAKVAALAPQIKIVNNSNSGGILMQRFDDWNAKFNSAKNALDTLNGKVIEVSKSNTQIEHETGNVTR